MDRSKQDELLREAFRHREVLLGYAYGMLCDWHAAQDAVQEAFIAVGHANNLEPGPGFTAWLKRVTRNKAVDLVRQRENVKRINKNLSTLAADSLDQYLGDTENAQLVEERRRIMHGCVRKLNRRTLGIFQGFYRHGMSCAAIAERYGRSVNAVRLSLSKARKMVRKCVAGQLEAG